jgi:hypothetical protein
MTKDQIVAPEFSTVAFNTLPTDSAATTATSGQLRLQANVGGSVPRGLAASPAVVIAIGVVAVLLLAATVLAAVITRRGERLAAERSPVLQLAQAQGGLDHSGSSASFAEPPEQTLQMRALQDGCVFLRPQRGSL